MKLDATNVRGEKQLLEGDPMVLKGFEFNIDGPLSSTLRTTVGSTFNRTTGAASITIPAMVPTRSISAPGGATHYKIVGGAAAVDFTTKTADADTDESAYLPLDNNQASALTLAFSLPANATAPVLNVVGIKFFLDDNGVKYPLNNGAYNSMSIVDIDV
jgi:hypothetical protein